MTTVTFNARAFSLKNGESVLDCLLRNQQRIPFSCRSGNCQSCLIKAVSCNPDEDAARSVSRPLRDKGYALACQWHPNTDIEVSLPDMEELAIPVKISRLDRLNCRIMGVQLEVDDPAAMFHYRPGQFLGLVHPDGMVRSYSIANDFETDHYVELHVSRSRKGAFSGWLFEQARIGDSLHIRGPAGDCYYRGSEGSDHPLLLAGTGSGLAPLYGIIRDALASRHSGPIDLFHGGRTPDELYYVQELTLLSEQHPHFRYVPCILEMNRADSAGLQTGSVADIIDRLHGNNLSTTRAFICGPPGLVEELRKKLFLKGVRASHIRSDPFIEQAIPAESASA